MADSNIIELILKVKDLSNEAIKRLKENLEDLPDSVGKINEAFKTLKILPTTEVEAQKAKIIAAFEDIKKSGTASAEEIQRAETAKNKAITDLERDNFTERKNLLTSLKEHWVAVSVAVVAGWVTAQKAMEFAEIGAKALQAEEAFRNVTQSYEVNGDKLLAKMKEVSAGAIDESNLMQMAMRALQQGLNPDQIVSLLEVARSSARIAGTDIANAFEKISEAAANQMTRGLKSMGIVIDNAKAFEEYASQIGKAKEALTEQEQSQAIANAAIAEGLRQREKMGTLLINENEQLQINKARFDELKETVGKGLVVALGLAVKNIDAIGFALSATAIMNAPAVIKAIIVQLETLTVASGTASIAMKSALVGLASFIGYEVGGAVDKLIYKLTNIDLSGLNIPLKNITNITQELNRNTAELNSRLAEMGFVGPDAWKRYNAAIETGNLLTDTATGKITNLLERLKQSIALMGAQIQTLQMSSQFEMDLVKKDFETGKITMEQYLAFIKKKQSEITEAQITEVQKRIEETKKEYQMKMISEDEMKSRIAVLNEDIRKLKLQAISDSQRAYDEAIKKVEENSRKATEEAKKEQQKEFDNWNVLQELKLNTMKANIELQTALDDAAVKAGVIRESTAMQNKLALTQAFYKEQLRIAEETAWKQAESYGWDSAEYKKALTDKEKLQMEYQRTTISSEAAIAESKKKEVLNAENFIADILDDSFRKEEAQRQEKLGQLEQYYQQGLISAEDYYDALNVLEDQATSEFKRDLKERSEQLNMMVAVIEDRTKKMWDAVSGFFEIGYDDVKTYFRDVKKALELDIDNIKNQVSSFLRSVNSTSTATFWTASLFGRRMVDMVGTSIYEWARRVTEYVQYVKSLMASLQNTIENYRIQLAQLRGDRLAELALQYQQERKALEEKYKDELNRTQEYYEALALLDQIYAEKKKKATEEMQQNEALKQEETESTKNTGSPAGGISTALPLLTDFASQIQIMKQEHTLNINLSLNAPNYDPESTRRWTRDIFFPIFNDILKNKGFEGF